MADIHNLAGEGARRDLLRIIEALLFASRTPLGESDLAAHLPAGTDVAVLVRALAADYAGRGVELVRVDGKWLFRTAPDLASALRPQAQENRPLTRAQLEMLAIIAYHQPVTRAEIEDIRGVRTASGTLDVLLETGWVRMRGRRRTPGRPITFGTTPAFLLQFGLEAITDLPGIEELKGAGLFDGRLPPGFGVPVPNDELMLADDEDPILEGETLDDDEPDASVAEEPCAD